MTQTQYTKAIEQQLFRLNKQIDKKIMRGETYSTESKKHKLLLDKIRSQRGNSFFTRFLFSI